MLQAAEYDRRKMSMSHDDGHGSLPADPALALADVAFAPATARVLPTTLRAVPPLGEPVAHKEVAFGEEMDMDAMMKGAHTAARRACASRSTATPTRRTVRR